MCTVLNVENECPAVYWIGGFIQEKKLTRKKVCHFGNETLVIWERETLVIEWKIPLMEIFVKLDE